jgi:hypothetical protein
VDPCVGFWFWFCIPLTFCKADADPGTDTEGTAEESHREGAVAKKNFSLSRCASLSCSTGLRGRERPPERPGVDVV